MKHLKKFNEEFFPDQNGDQFYEDEFPEDNEGPYNERKEKIIETVAEMSEDSGRGFVEWLDELSEDSFDELYKIFAGSGALGPIDESKTNEGKIEKTSSRDKMEATIKGLKAAKKYLEGEMERHAPIGADIPAYQTERMHREQRIQDIQDMIDEIKKAAKKKK